MVTNIKYDIIIQWMQLNISAAPSARGWGERQAGPGASSVHP